MNGRPPRCGETGIALFHVMLLMTMVTAVAGGAAMLARLEMLVSRYHRDERDAAYSARAMLAATLQDLDRTPGWNDVLAGSRHASFADGPVAVPREIPGGGTVVVCCGSGSMTSRVQTETGLPWRPFGWRSMSGLLNIPNAPRQYAIAWVTDDPDDLDGDPAADSNNRMVVRAEAVTPRGVRKAVEATVQRAPPDSVSGVYSPGLQILTWREPQ